MKKRFLAATLALALCMGLAVPAFAADGDSAPRASRSVPNQSGILLEGKTDTYQSRMCAFDESQSAFVYGEAADLGVTTTLLVPKGVDISVSGVEPASLKFVALSDPDGDGTFDQRLFMKEQDKDISVAPLKDSYAGEGVLFNGSVTAEELGVKAAEDGSIVLTSDWLYGLFDVNTMLWLGVGDELMWMYTLSGEPTVITDIFTDVAVGDWLTDAVVWARYGDITNGTSPTAFSPDENCTQAQILTFLWRAAGEPVAAGELPFVVADAYRGALLWANDMGMIDPGTFDPNAACTRSAAVRFICQAFAVPYESPVDSGFTDVDADADYAYAVAWAVENGITNGTDEDAGLFSPDRVCSRGQIVTFLHRAYVESARLSVD